MRTTPRFSDARGEAAVDLTCAKNNRQLVREARSVDYLATSFGSFYALLAIRLSA